MNKEDIWKQRDYVWKYFEMHAAQRMKIFNFYLILSGFTIGGFFTLQKQFLGYKWLSILPFLQFFLTVVFWLLEVRTKQLVKNGENALKELDNQLDYDIERINAEIFNLFQNDDRIMDGSKKLWFIKLSKYSYSDCFNAVFLVFLLLSLITGIMCLYIGYK